MRTRILYASTQHVSTPNKCRWIKAIEFAIYHLYDHRHASKWMKHGNSRTRISERGKMFPLHRQYLGAKGHGPTNVGKTGIKSIPYAVIKGKRFLYRFMPNIGLFVADGLVINNRQTRVVARLNISLYSAGKKANAKIGHKLTTPSSTEKKWKKIRKRESYVPLKYFLVPFLLGINIMVLPIESNLHPKTILFDYYPQILVLPHASSSSSFRW